MQQSILSFQKTSNVKLIQSKIPQNPLQNRQTWFLKYREEKISKIPIRKGFLYCYQYQDQTDRPCYKIGFTGNSVQKRMQQWLNDDGKTPILNFCIPSNDANLLQYYVHDYFYNYRFIRKIQNQKTLKIKNRIQWFDFRDIPLNYVLMVAMLIDLHPRSEKINPLQSVHKQVSIIFPQVNINVPRKYMQGQRNLHFEIISKELQDYEQSLINQQFQKQIKEDEVETQDSNNSSSKKSPFFKKSQESLIQTNSNSIDTKSQSVKSLDDIKTNKEIEFINNFSQKKQQNNQIINFTQTTNKALINEQKEDKNQFKKIEDKIKNYQQLIQIKNSTISSKDKKITIINLIDSQDQQQNIQQLQNDIKIHQVKLQKMDDQPELSNQNKRKIQKKSQQDKAFIDLTQQFDKLSL